MVVFLAKARGIVKKLSFKQISLNVFSYVGHVLKFSTLSLSEVGPDQIKTLKNNWKLNRKVLSGSYCLTP